MRYHPSYGVFDSKERELTQAEVIEESVMKYRFLVDERSLEGKTESLIYVTYTYLERNIDYAASYTFDLLLGEIVIVPVPLDEYISRYKQDHDIKLVAIKEVKDACVGFLKIVDPKPVEIDASEFYENLYSYNKHKDEGVVISHHFVSPALDQAESYAIGHQPSFTCLRYSTDGLATWYLRINGKYYTYLSLHRARNCNVEKEVKSHLGM